ncbi:MAG TPA: hypothetical protein VF884_12965 [Nitrososphaeraceae archaeon]
MSTASNVIRKDEPFTCLLCGRTFYDKQTLQIHKEKDHSISLESPAGFG